MSRRHRRRPRAGRGWAIPLRALAALCASLVAALCAPGAAHAYVRYKTSTGNGFFWPQTCVPVSVYPLSMQDANGNMEMTSDEILHAVTEAAAAWSGGDNTCTYLQINVTASTGPTPKAGLDYTNTVTFRVNSWCAPTDGPGKCTYAAEALAITSVFVNRQSGRIFDADIEVNAKNFVWTDLDLDPMGARKQDLQNALTHEMGHLIGLDHTCYIPDPTAEPPTTPPLDNNGNPVPDCATASAEVQATTMFASAIPGDEAKRTLAPDDIQAVCDIYSLASDPMICPAKDEPPPSGGCAVSASRAGVLGGVFAMLAAFAFATRRRSRRG